MKRPSQQFEKKYGIEGISRVYTIPDSPYIDYHQESDPIKRADILEDTINRWLERGERHWREKSDAEERSNWEKYGAGIEAIARSLIRENQELGAVLDPDGGYNPEEFEYIISGVTSGFNPWDIYHFLSGERLGPGNSGYRMQEAIKNKLPYSGDLNWQASPWTLEKIRQQLRANKVLSLLRAFGTPHV